jgi:REP element-mobilizing transposase RayT
LCAGLDHIHLHINSPPDYSADEVVRKIMEFSEPAIKNEFPKLFERKEIFGKTYFIETIG